MSMSGNRRSVRRKAQRLPGFDYSQGYAYFITMCVENRSDLFGAISNTGQVNLSPAGEMIKQVWSAMPEYNPGLILDEFIVMPDHFHGILGFVDPRFWSGRCRSATEKAGDPSADECGKRLNLSIIVRKFKTLTTRNYGDGVRRSGWPPYDGHLWQRSFWDRILRNDRDLESHRQYIYNNPIAKQMNAARKVDPDSTGQP